EPAAAKEKAPEKPPTSSKRAAAPTPMAAPRNEDANKPASQGGGETATTISKGSKHIVLKRSTKPKKDPDEGLYELAPAHEPPKNFNPPTVAATAEGGASPAAPPGMMGTAIQPKKKYEEEPPDTKTKNKTLPLMLYITALMLYPMYCSFMKLGDIGLGT